jgi:hypothetical protein
MNGIYHGEVYCKTVSKTVCDNDGRCTCHVVNGVIYRIICLYKNMATHRMLFLGGGGLKCFDQRYIQCNSAVLTRKNLVQNIVVANVLAQKIFCREIFGQ